MNELFLPLLATQLVAFISALLLFEVTERRRARLSQRELQRALVADLENSEALASSIVFKYAWICQSKEDFAVVAREIRWFLGVGRERMQDVGIVADRPPNSSELRSLSDDQLVAVFSSTKETVGTKIIMPVLERALAGQTLGFRANQIQVLSMVRWQMYLLEQDAESMHEMFRLSFTVTDKKNYKIVLENHVQRSVAYAHRAQTLLRAMRRALELMR